MGRKPSGLRHSMQTVAEFMQSRLRQLEQLARLQARRQQRSIRMRWSNPGRSKPWRLNTCDVCETYGANGYVEDIMVCWHKSCREAAKERTQNFVRSLTA